MSHLLRALLCLALLSLFSCKLQQESTLKISGGTLSYNYPFVTPIFNASTGEKFCSAVFISKKVAVSAAHCFINQFNGRLAKPPVVVNGKGVFLADKVYLPKKYHPESPPELQAKPNPQNPFPQGLPESNDAGVRLWQGNQAATPAIDPQKQRQQPDTNTAPATTDPKWAYDFAVIVFSDVVTESVIGLKTRGSLAVGAEDLRAIGFGCNDAVAGLMNDGSVLKRAYQGGLIQWMSPNPMKVTEIEFGNKSDANAYRVEGSVKVDKDNMAVSVCPGDSGGALVKGKELVGVTSRYTPRRDGSGDRDSIFTSLSHSYPSRVIQRVVKGTVSVADDLHILTEVEGFKLAAETERKLKSNYASEQKFLQANKAAIAKELQEVYREFLKRKKTIAADNKVGDEQRQAQDKLLPVLVKKINTLAAKHAKLSPKVFPSLAKQIPQAKVRVHSYQSPTMSVENHLRSLYSCTQFRSSQHHGVFLTTPINGSQDPCIGLKLDYLLSYFVSTIKEGVIHLWDEADNQGQNQNGISMPANGEQSRPAEGQNIEEDEFAPKVPPALTSMIAADAATLLQIVAKLSKKKNHSGAVIVPLYSFALHQSNSSFAVPTKVEAVVVHAGKVIETVVLFQK